jgi:hypothetical protein
LYNKINNCKNDPELQGDETITEDYKQAWLDALEDYKPVPKEVEAKILSYREAILNPMAANGKEKIE